MKTKGRSLNRRLRLSRRFSLTLTKNGQVLIVGGPVAELYDPSTKKFLGTSGAPSVARKDHAAVLLQMAEF
jgi:hypothetical protein